MATYQYPAVLKQEADGLYAVCFPDIESCVSCGATLAQALEMAEDALSLILYDMEQEGAPIPDPTPIENVLCDGFCIRIVPICVDTDEYERQYCRCRDTHEGGNE
ncbi:type II toxin-antitoxin system HicB family antitoxin [Christensenella timonensis]|uniref:type II toxin-antitoxin system HicB family antitoxin n=1 Tax=Christensenella timonensis TaxID=1816678 RepID=UPI00082D457D|nr:type II toxin-antitoxin system HicB family antitoxin [Christensenella timonensis]